MKPKKKTGKEKGQGQIRTDAEIIEALKVTDGDLKKAAESLSYTDYAIRKRAKRNPEIKMLIKARGVFTGHNKYRYYPGRPYLYSDEQLIEAIKLEGTVFRAAKKLGCQSSVFYVRRRKSETVRQAIIEAQINLADEAVEGLKEHLKQTKDRKIRMEAINRILAIFGSRIGVPKPITQIRHGGAKGASPIKVESAVIDLEKLLTVKELQTILERWEKQSGEERKQHEPEPEQADRTTGDGIRKSVSGQDQPIPPGPTPA